nr:helix-turn-helix domain-containing protein [uncultured Blautia sp.]
MISYKPFYETMFKKDITEYALIYKFGIPANTIHRMKHGKPITTTTLDTLCSILECEVEDILKYIPPEAI